jgi:pimeloyl-ACP methyl ester carboxylesterase
LEKNVATINVNGINLYYREAGSGEPLLLVHGAGFNADVWEPVFDALANDYRTIIYDRRGYQRSQGTPPPIANYGRQHGEDIAKLLQALDAAPANVVGWSMGGIHALHAALMYPDRIKRLVLYEAPLYAMRFIDFTLLKGFTKIHLLKAIGKKHAAAKIFARMVLAYQDGRNSYDRLSMEFRAKLTADADTLLAEIAAGCGEELKPEILSTQIKVPVTLLVGEQTLSFLKKPMENLSRILPNAPLVWLPESNHLAHIDHPDRFVKAVKEALAQK